MQHKGTIAYCTVPKIGGTFNYFRNLRQSLELHGWRVIAPTVGQKLNALWDPAYADPDCQPVAADVLDERAQAQQLVQWCETAGVDFLLPMSTPAAVSAIPHLGPRTTPLYRCSNITRHAYDIVTEHLEYVPAVIATSQRQWDDLKQRRHVAEEKLFLIPHGTDNRLFEAAFLRRTSLKGNESQASIRLGYLGRLLDSAKGVMLLPSVLDELDRRRVPFSLDIIGDGPDRPALERALKGRPQIRWMGNQANERVPALLAELDVLLMPSRFEGFGFSLIEAMSAGVVPVVSRIRGVTDWIVEDGQTGFVAPIGHAGSFASRVDELFRHPERRIAMSERAHWEAKTRFGLDRLGADYDRLFTSLLRQSDRPAPQPWDSFRAASGFQPTFRRWIPESWKGWMRGWLERLGMGA